jgi:hypothetical protein
VVEHFLGREEVVSSILTNGSFLRQSEMRDSEQDDEKCPSNNSG